MDRAEAPVQLVACPVCHTQYDVSPVLTAEITCRCGETIENRALRAVDAEIARCGSCGAQVQPDARSCTYCGSAIVRDPDQLSLICPECFARNSDRSRFCVACGVAFAPQPLPSEGRELPCPACDTRMPPTQVAGIAVNECPGCHGLWVPGDHFDALVKRAAQLREQRAPTADAPRVQRGRPTDREVRYRRCPECDQFMLRINYRRSSGVILDECRAHGTWLDADELEQVAGFILAGGHTSKMLEAEHQAADREAAAAFSRARVEQRVDQYTHGATHHRSLLDLFLKILD
jgi:Zn-finger nucleic acid-binding protein/ribosomal protein L40E